MWILDRSSKIFTLLIILLNKENRGGPKMAFVALNHLSLSYPGYGFPANTSPTAISLYLSSQNRSTSPFLSRHFWKTQVSGNPKWTIHCSANASLTSEVFPFNFTFSLNGFCGFWFSIWWVFGIMQENVIVKEKSVSVILLAGGNGKRMGVCS